MPSRRLWAGVVGWPGRLACDKQGAEGAESWPVGPSSRLDSMHSLIAALGVLRPPPAPALGGSDRVTVGRPLVSPVSMLSSVREHGILPTWGV